MAADDVKIDEKTVAEFLRRIDVLESKEEIRALRNTFHDFVDTDRWMEIGGLSTEDAVLDYSYLGQATGREALGEFFGSIPDLLPIEGGAPFVRQFIHAHTVSVDESGDKGSGTSHLLATPIYNSASFLFSGRFDDRYRRVDGRWLFSSVSLDIWYSVPLAEGRARSGIGCRCSVRRPVSGHARRWRA